MEFLKATESERKEVDEFNSIKTGSSQPRPDLVSVPVVDMPNAVEIQSKMAATPENGPLAGKRRRQRHSAATQLIGAQSLADLAQGRTYVSVRLQLDFISISILCDRTLLVACSFNSPHRSSTALRGNSFI